MVVCVDAKSVEGAMIYIRDLVSSLSIIATLLFQLDHAQSTLSLLDFSIPLQRYDSKNSQISHNQLFRHIVYEFATFL